MLHTSNVLWERITVKETGFAGVELLRENNLKLHDKLGNMVEVVFQSEVPFLTFTLGLVPVEMLVDALANATVWEKSDRKLS